MTPCRRSLCCVLLYCLCLPLSFSQDVQHTEVAETKTMVAGAIQSQLERLKKEYTNMENRLNDLSRTLMQSESELQAMKSQSMGLLNSLQNTTEQLEYSLRIIISYEQELAQKEILLAKQEEDLEFRTKLFTIGLIIVGIRLFMVVVGWILYLTNTRIPKWLDLIM